MCFCGVVRHEISLAVVGLPYRPKGNSNRVSQVTCLPSTGLTGCIDTLRTRSRSSSPANPEMSNYNRNGNAGRNSRGNMANMTQANWRPNRDAQEHQLNGQPRQGPHFQGPSRQGPPPPRITADSVPLSTVSPGAAWPTTEQLSVAYGYGYRREDGSVTRLVPADELAFANVPPRQGAEGLILVPVPAQQAPNLRVGEPMVPTHVVQSLPGFGRPSETQVQQQIDNIVQLSSALMIPRREKIYCDKWIHEGVCAFTQMGCKYKHEMPTDKATQISLGLNHGTPNWYRRTFGSVTAQSPSSTQAAIAGGGGPPAHHGNRGNHGGGHGGNRIEGPWRSVRTQGGMQGGPSRQDGGGARLDVGLRGNARGGGQNLGFGAIAPPRYNPGNGNNVNSNPTNLNNPNNAAKNRFSGLKNEEEDDDEDEDEITFQGRRH
ncbi:uncharacterized protein L3040_005760 [Drepanopeziza brunnea f. sp. 'multigermtubi']|uniref:uncharacterized protein n=1 Tax=Drepanopeziza brunnea f. sp. 'multigermtubi' TaxID=698441 RepID=UPI002383CD36|nr:hypothetical protein L3040_005760 [Drepanopeziza brunnea f. sp. 'multigermtubi']